MRKEQIKTNELASTKPLLNKEEFDSIAKYVTERDNFKDAHYSIEVHTIGLGGYELPQIVSTPTQQIGVVVCFVLWGILFTKKIKNYLNSNL
jgi:hypothetical protein